MNEASISPLESALLRVLCTHTLKSEYRNTETFEEVKAMGWDYFNEIVDQLGADFALDALMRWLGDDQLKKAAQDISRDWELGGI